MNLFNGIYLIFIGVLCTTYARRNLYDSKCKRNCNTEEGTFECWKTTTDGFAYGLSTAMIDFCQTILQNRQQTNISSYEKTRAILVKQIKQYELDDGVHQLTKDKIEHIAISLLDKCFNASSNMTSSEASCPSCPENDSRKIHQWRLSSIILVSIALFLGVIILFLHFVQSYSIHRRSYSPMK